MIKKTLFLVPLLLASLDAKAPVWFKSDLTLTKNDGYVYGCAQGETEDQAKSRAISNLGSQIRLKVESKTTTVNQESNLNDQIINQSNYKQEVDAKVNDEYEGLEVFRKESDEDFVYLCMRLNRAEHERLSREKELKAALEIESILTEAQNKLNQGTWTLSAQSLRVAQTKLKVWEDRGVILKTETHQLSQMNLEIAQQLVEALQLKNTQGEATYQKGNSLTLPFSLSLKSKAVESFPFLISLDQGNTWQKLLSQNGQITIPLALLNPKPNQIKAKMDVEALQKDFPFEGNVKLSASSAAQIQVWKVVEAAKEIRIEIGDCNANNAQYCTDFLKFFKDALARKGYTPSSSPALPLNKVSLSLEIRPVLDIGGMSTIPSIATATFDKNLGNNQVEAIQSTQKGMSADADASARGAIKKAAEDLAKKLD